MSLYHLRQALMINDQKYTIPTLVADLTEKMQRDFLWELERK